MTREQPCACGGRIVVTADDRRITTIVAAHNQTPRHNAWRQRNSL